MSKEKIVGGRKTQEVEKLIKEHETEIIASLEEKLKGLKLAHQTNVFTVPVTKIKLDEIEGSSLVPWASFWELDKISLKTPIIFGREKNILVGDTQFFNAKQNGFSEIDVIYFDSLKAKIISPKNFKKQFKDKDIRLGLAYSLYSLLFDLRYCISYEDFCKNFEELFEQKEVCCHIYDYILSLDEEYGS